MKLVEKIYFCFDYQFSLKFARIVKDLYSIQTVIVIGILFYRLYKVFGRKPFQLSKFVTYSFITCYTFLCVLLIFFNIFGMTSMINYAISVIVGVIIFIYILIMNVWLVFLFIFKLIQTYGCEEADESLIELITKISILCFTSAFTVLLTSIFVSLSLEITSYHWYFILDIFVIMDLYTNFLCVLLSFRYFDRFYLTICKCCDHQCYECWRRCIQVLKTRKLSKSNDSIDSETTVEPTNEISDNGTGNPMFLCHEEPIDI